MAVSRPDLSLIVSGTAKALKECLFSNEISNQHLLQLLNRFGEVASESSGFVWDHNVEELLLTLKLCMIYNDPIYKKVFKYTVTQDYWRVSKWKFFGITLCKKACEVIRVISEKISDKFCYRLLYLLVEDPNHQSFRLSDLFKSSPIDESKKYGDAMSYGALIPVTTFIIFRSKQLLASAESRKTTTSMYHCKDVNFTSISTEMAYVLKNLLSLGLKMCEYTFLQSQPELELKTIQNFVNEVANACPFERLDPDVFGILLRCIEAIHMSRPKLCSRSTFTMLCNIVLKYDPEPSGSLECLLGEKQLYRLGEKVQRVSSVVVDCYRSITTWISAIYLNSQFISAHCITATSELRLLSALCKTKGFSDCIFKECTLLLRLIVCIFRSANVLEASLTKGSYGNEPSQRSDITIKMTPVVEATNLLALLVKLCSQKTAEESCSWSYEVEEMKVENSSFNEFVVLWSIIIDILPGLMKSQVTSVPMGILNAIAEFGEQLFTLLQETPLQRSIVTTVLVYCGTSVKADIRGKAGRALARLIEFETLSEELNFSMDTFDAIKTNMNAPELSVRSSFSWAFGNWSDIYLQNYVSSCEKEENALVLDQLIVDFHSIIMISHEDKAKVKYNVYRAAGNLLRSLLYVDPKHASKIKDIVSVLIDQVGKGFDFKARWNASCALRTVFTNESLLCQLGHDIVDRTMQCFMKFMCQSENFKERAQCVIGVASINKRIHYGGYFMTLWGKLINASTQGPLDLCGEVGPAEKLNIEVGRGYIHLIALLTVQDLETLWETIDAKWENIQNIIRFTLRHMPSEDFYPIRSLVNLEKLMTSKLRSSELEVCKKLYSLIEHDQFRLESRER